MGYLFSSILAVSFFVYLAFKLKSTFVKVGLLIIILIFETILSSTCMAGNLIFNGFWFAYLSFIVIQFLICTFYKVRYISRTEIAVGILIGGLIALYMYFNGSVVGEMEYFDGDAGGMQAHIPYKFYRWLTYIFDVLLVWFPIFNLLISPFWLRRQNSQHYVKQMICKISENG